MVINKGEQKVFDYLDKLRLAGYLTNIIAQQKYNLVNKNKNIITTYTPDFFIINKNKMSAIIEVKGSEKAHSYLRRDYALKRKWLLTDYPNLAFFEAIPKKNGIEFIRCELKNGRVKRIKLKNFGLKE